LLAASLAGGCREQRMPSKAVPSTVLDALEQALHVYGS
jgi:hypothetical protein